MTDEEVREVSRSFWGEHARRDKALFLLGVRSGFRISELLSLRLRDVWQAGRLVDRVAIERRHMKKKLEGRTVLLHPEAKAALADWLQELGNWREPLPETYVFQSRKGDNSPITRVQAYRILHEACDSCEMTGKLGTHSMRKTFANKVYDALDNDLVKTQRALGHRNVNSTVQYLSFREEEIDEAILSL